MSTNMFASCSSSQMSTLVFLALANHVSTPIYSVSRKSLPAASSYQAPPKLYQSLCSCSPRCQNGVGVHSAQRSPLPQHGATFWQSVPQSFCNCGKGLLKYLNGPVNLGLYIVFTVGSSKLAQMTILISFIPLSILPVTIPEQSIFLLPSVTKYMYRDKQMQYLDWRRAKQRLLSIPGVGKLWPTSQIKPST